MPFLTGRDRDAAFEIMEVPTKSSLADIYPDTALKAQTKRWQALVSKFKETYGKVPDYVARSPGRVNLIGEVSLLYRSGREW